MTRICIVPVAKSGGGGSFRLKFEAGLHSRGIEVTHNLDEESNAILVIGGTRNLLPLWKAKQRGTRIVQRNERSTDCGGAGSAIGLQCVAVENDLPFAELFHNSQIDLGARCLD